jgi:phage shock protein A
MIAQEKETEAELADAQRDSTEWGKKAELALSHGREDLAREALRRKRDADSIAEVYEHQLTTQRELVTKLRQQLRVLDAKYNEAESKRAQLIARHRATQAQQRVAETFSSLPDMSAMSEMERMEKRIRSEEARTAALQEMETSSIEWEFAELETDDDLEFELMELKARMGIEPAGSLGSGATTVEPPPSLGSGSTGSTG